MFYNRPLYFISLNSINLWWHFFQLLHWVFYLNCKVITLNFLHFWLNKTPQNKTNKRNITLNKIWASLYPLLSVLDYPRILLETEEISTANHPVTADRRYSILKAPNITVDEKIPITNYPIYCCPITYGKANKSLWNHATWCSGEIQIVFRKYFFHFSSFQNRIFLEIFF